MTLRITLTLLITAALAACGGGGGATADVATTQEPTAITAPATVASLLPGATMTWATRAEQPLVIELQGADGRPAAGAGVRVFTLSRSSPQDGALLESPVPVSLLDSAVSDAAGRVAITLQLPGHVDEVLVKATLGDTQGERAVAVVTGLATGATVALTLAR